MAQASARALEEHCDNVDDGRVAQRLDDVDDVEDKLQPAEAVDWWELFIKSITG